MIREVTDIHYQHKGDDIQGESERETRPAAEYFIAIYIMAIISGFFPARGPEGLFF